ncbi:hypothetical protein Lser_V15G29860 [Lactuca serriola]
MSTQGFDKNSGPGTGTGTQKQQPSFGFRPPSQSPYTWFNASSQKPQVHQGSALQPMNPSRNPRTESPAKNQIQDLKRTRSPPLLPTYKDILQNSRTVVVRPSVSPPRSTARRNPYTDPENHIWSPQYTDLDKPETPAINPSDIPVPKRSRLPFTTSNDPVLDDSERELQAKAKRLARFRDELSQPESTDKNQNQKRQQVDQLGMDKRKFMLEGSDMGGHLRNSNANIQTDSEDQDSSSTVITGVCPDMCPEQERAERERKGDLDQYERLDGDRNQTTESLAVKKYTRTAEREAALIRPMAILQKTMDYLLNLLDQSYDDRFLGLYNFLWDRMRAIRMDLRMQHIFNLGAITMLEQMIRLHIIAMHELCQYTKGEGFAEGFDAHLNIEQMNKTSVELFQLYDDHRKKGIEVPTEREFRGYYALLKLDKHPGYKVEPSELSLDLAKMTPGIRQAEEVLFARNVARACRTGNFITFFRLLRKATYLQACLMHAHFGKLRTQALASLHSGLQNNQGIPVTLIGKWLGMEEENMEDLLEYHGFSIKEFDEPYMVKEGQFLNTDSEYPLKCSKLVHLKRSTTIMDDVLSSPIPIKTPEPPKRVPRKASIQTQVKSPVSPKKTQSFADVIRNRMADYGGSPSVKEPPVFTIPVVERRNDVEVGIGTPSPRNMFKNIFKTNKLPDASQDVRKPSFDNRFRNSLEKHTPVNVFAMPPQVPPMVDPVLVEDSVVEVDPVFVEDMEPEESENVIQEVEEEVDTSVDEEVAEAKLRLILRLWKRRAFIKKDLREKKQLVANAALSSLSLGPPMRLHKEQSKVHGNFNIDKAMSERYEKQEQMWSPLNVSNVVGPTLGERNQYPRIICWKLLFCPSQDSNQENPDPHSWLHHKLIPENIPQNNNLAASFPGLSIWEKWDYRKSSTSSDPTCYLSVVKNVKFDNLLEDSVSGASAVMFLSSEHVSWDTQKNRLRVLTSSIPYGSRLPLLIISFSPENRSKVIEKLGLDELDNSRIGSYSVLPGLFLGDKDLKMGLEWLASESPLQPVVHCVKTHELVMKNLKFSSDLLQKTSPEHCVLVINRAVDESINEIGNASKSNPVNWPCPEISLLNGVDFEPYLPSIGWSSGKRVDPLIQALRDCKLPTPDHVWSRTWDDIESQRVGLEGFMVGYLGPLIGPLLARKEASALIQNHVGLELNGSMYSLVPNWAMIFRRVFNWRLMGISNGPYSSAYILSDQNSSLFDLESFEGEVCDVVAPSLDEMIEVSCLASRVESELGYGELSCQAPRSELELGYGELDGTELEVVVNGDELMEVEGEKEKEYVENERSLSRLLEKCNIVQDIIDKKLSIYF